MWSPVGIMSLRKLPHDLNVAKRWLLFWWDRLTGRGTSPDQGDWAQFTPLLLCVDLSVFPVFQICHMDGNKKLMRTDKCILLSKCLHRNYFQPFWFLICFNIKVIFVEEKYDGI